MPRNRLCITIILVLVGVPLFSAPDTPAAEPLPVGTNKEANRTTSRQVGRGVFVWETEKLLTTFTAKQLAFRFRSLSFTRVLFGLRGDTIATIGRCRGQPQAAGCAIHGQVTQFINALRRDGLRADLLLGDPSWILDAGRNELSRIIDRLSDLPVDGINLDLEPNQLADDSKIDKTLLMSLASTLKRAKEVSPWPVSLTIHPRYILSEELIARQAEPYDLGKELEKMQLSEVIVMIYSSNPLTVTSRLQSLLDRYKGLPFSVAQSIESILDPTEAHPERRPDLLFPKLESVAKLLADRTNGRDVVIQSFEYIQAPPPDTP